MQVVLSSEFELRSNSIIILLPCENIQLFVNDVKTWELKHENF